MGSGEGDAAMWCCTDCDCRFPVRTPEDIDKGLAHAETHREDDPAEPCEAPTL